MISWKAPKTVAATLETYDGAGILDLFAAKLIEFNEIGEADFAVARRFGFAAAGSAENRGIFGAVEALAARTSTSYLLSLENDCPLVCGRDAFLAMMRNALADMDALGIPVFSMRSRRKPGDQFTRRERYERKFRPVWPIGTDGGARHPLPSLVRRAYEDTRRSGLRGCAIYAEEDPTLRHPRVITRTPNGNWLTTGAYLNWSNQSILVRTDFLRDVILDHVRRFPATTTLNGHQDIEAALKRDDWWRRQNFKIAQCEPGSFTHERLDR